MIILSLRTDKPEAEIGLFDDTEQIAYQTWTAYRQLAETLHTKIAELLESHNMELGSINAVVCYKGPGSFTGLRIGLSVANALAYGLQIPIIGKEHEDWLETSLAEARSGVGGELVLPEYGAPVHITQAKK